MSDCTKSECLETTELRKQKEALIILTDLNPSTTPSRNMRRIRVSSEDKQDLNRSFSDPAAGQISSTSSTPDQLDPGNKPGSNLDPGNKPGS